MGKIIRNGIEYSGTYDSADSVNYDNSISGLNARTVQEGIDELNNRLVAFPDFSNVIETYTENKEYTISSDGYLIGVLSIKSGGVNIKALVNDVVVCVASAVSANYTNRDSVAIPVKEGMILKFEDTSNGAASTTIDFKLYGFL